MIGFFAGRVGQKAVVKALDSGMFVTNFSVAEDRGKDSDGEKRSPLWIKVAIWGERGKKLAQYLTPGTVVAISGPIELDSYEKDGNTITQIKCRMDQLTLLGGGQKDGDEENSEDECPI